jgi:propionyl-CoA carboxylase beta chain
MGGGGAVNVLFRKEIEQSEDPEKTRREKMEEYTERFSGPFEALSKQFAHAAIRPEETRRRLIQALDILKEKREERPKKKHGVMPV